MMASAKAHPHKAAVIEIDANGNLGTVSYGQLDNQVRDFAAALEELGLDVGDRVVLEANASARAIAMLLACSWLGLTFIPASPETADRRILTIIDIADPALHLQAVEGHRAAIPAHVAAARFCEHGLTVDRPPVPRIRHRREVLPTDPAYIIFTSGSTGVPKGVVMSHRAVISFYRGVLHQDIVRADDRVAVTAPFQFDFSLAGIGAALGSGATVVLVPADRIGRPERFISFLHDTEATQVHGVPSIWRNVLKDEPDRLAVLDRLRLILFAGEEFPLHELRRLQCGLRKVDLMNAYGATETMACSVTVIPDPVPDDVTRLSIGFAHAGAEMMIVGDGGQPVEEPGEVGEIYIRSPAMFTGYWDDPAGTRAAQVPDPLNPRSGELVFRSGDLAYRGQHGELYFCGRADSQVQIRGNRVELGEVERRIADFPGVAEAAMLALPRPDGELGLNAFVVMQPGCSASGTDLRAFCAETLPGYMIPAHIHIMEELPLNDNGKVDRAALTAFTQSARHGA